MANSLRLTNDARGNWRRQNLGAKLGPDGELVKATFTFGKDFDNACKRVVILDQMWSAIEKDWQKDNGTAYPIWTQETYKIALAVARGENPVFLEVPPEERETADCYSDPETVLAVWIESLREMFPFLDLRIKGKAEAEAAEQAAADLAERLDRNADKMRGQAKRVRGHAEGEPLHAAFDAYSVYLQNRHGTSGHGRTQRTQIILLKDQLENQPINMLTADRIEAILAFIANRPLSNSSGKPLAFFTCRNLLITFRQFLRWLNRSDGYKWELPRSFVFPRQRIKKLPEDRVKRRKTFRLSELKIIWQYAMSWDRALILLALNCGFSRAEIATLQGGEVEIDRAGNTFIKRSRVKTDAYGEWMLWPETLEALAYLRKLHKGTTPYIVVSKTGRPLDKPTPKGNQNQTIKNHWDRLMKRVKEDYPEFHRLPFKHLRKTGASIIRKLAPKRATELASMYLAHGEKSDSADQLLPVYTDRPWRNLHKVLLKMRRRLLFVFESVNDPWDEKHHRVSPLKMERIRAMRAEGKTLQEIGTAVGLHWVTVGKYCRLEEQPAAPTDRSHGPELTGTEAR